MVSSELRARSIVLCPLILSDMLLTKYTHLYDGVHEGEPDPSYSVCKHQAAAIGIAGRSSIDPNLLAASMGTPVSGPGISGSSIGEYVIKHDHTPKPGWACPSCGGRGDNGDGSFSMSYEETRIRPATKCTLCNGKGRVLVTAIPD